MAASGITRTIGRFCGLGAFALLCAEGFAKPLRLPETAPRPIPSPHARVEAPPEIPQPPLPEPRPEQKAVPESGASDETGPNETRKDTPPVPTEELACRSRLRALGVDFAEHAPIDDPAGCAIAHPVIVKSLGRSIGLEPEAVLNCATAEATANFAAKVIAPAAKSVFGQDLASISNGSAYVCRPRNGTTKLSEHAFGNAIDVGGFILAGGRAIAVTAANDPKEADFLAKTRMEACGPFKTVLGPGTDADHAQHFHFDLARRRNGGTYCR